MTNANTWLCTWVTIRSGAILGSPGSRTCFPPMHLSRIYLHLSYLKRLTPTRTWQFSSNDGMYHFDVDFSRSLYHATKWKYSYTHPQQTVSHTLWLFHQPRMFSTKISMIFQSNYNLWIFFGAKNVTYSDCDIDSRFTWNLEHQ